MSSIPFSVGPGELEELVTALSAHHSELASALSRRCYSGGPDEVGIAMCIRRQKVEHLLDRLRCLNAPKSPHALAQCNPCEGGAA